MYSWTRFFFSFARGQVSLHANICDLVLSVEPERGLGLESCKVKSMKKTTWKVWVLHLHFVFQSYE